MRGDAILVVGADSLVGRSLIERLENRGHHAIGSTRRLDSLSATRIFLDLEDPQRNWRIPDEVGHVFLVAAICDYQQCEALPNAWSVNVDCVPELARMALKRRKRVTFISTNMVFGGVLDNPTEGTAHAPSIAYGRQKSAGEKRLIEIAAELDARDLMNIVRLTKVIGPDTKPFPDWMKSISQKKAVKAFADLIFAPITLPYLVNSLTHLAENWVAGIFHLSGAESIDYASFLRRIVAAAGEQSSLALSTTSTEMGVKLIARPTYGGLSMANTTLATGLVPERIDQVVCYILENCGR